MDLQENNVIQNYISLPFGGQKFTKWFQNVYGNTKRQMKTGQS